MEYGNSRTAPFPIGPQVFQRHVWQPTLEYFLPIQMCHMRVNDRYQVWHGACHLDDARMAPVNHRHFDSYVQGPSTLTTFQPGEHVPGLDRGGWHDAGDHDLRVESQSETIRGLALMPSRTSWPRRAKAGPRWSMRAACMARWMRSGTLVGPGICRK